MFGPPAETVFYKLDRDCVGHVELGICTRENSDIVKCTYCTVYLLYISSVSIGKMFKLLFPTTKSMLRCCTNIFYTVSVHTSKTKLLLLIHI